jgi:AraC-like DNA-binding protein
MALAVMEQFRHPMSVDVARTGLSIAFLLLGAWHAWSGRRIDLVEARRRLRVWYASVTVLYALVAIAADWLWPGGLSASSVSLANAAALTALIFVVAVLGSIIAAESELAPAAVQSKPSAPAFEARAVAPATGPDSAQLSALQHLLEHDKVFREPDLSTTSLSQKLGMPEYRLRHLINRRLGHRNFNAFVNAYRLAEAEAALSDPAQAGVPILTIALDAGFGSIGPFNRAFKARTGLTPSEYRRIRLSSAGAAVESRTAVGPGATVRPGAAET